MITTRLLLLLGLAALVYFGLQPTQWGYLVLHVQGHVLNIPLFVAILALLLCCLASICLSQLIAWAPKRLNEWKIQRTLKTLQAQIQDHDQALTDTTQGKHPISAKNKQNTPLSTWVQDYNHLIECLGQTHPQAALPQTPLAHALVHHLLKQSTPPDPSTPLLHLLTTTTATTADDIEQAIHSLLEHKHIKTLCTQFPQPFQTWLAQSLSHLQTDTLQTLWHVLPKSFKQAPSLFIAWTQALHQQGQMLQALPLLKKAIKHTEHPEIIAHAGLVWPETHLDDAVKRFEHAQKHSECPEITLGLARLHQRQQHYSQASALYQDIEGFIKTQGPALCLETALIYYTAGQVKQAYIWSNTAQQQLSAMGICPMVRDPHIDT